MGFPDEDPQSKIPKDDPNLLKNRPILDRAIVLSAGVVFNIIFAWSILFTQASILSAPLVLCKSRTLHSYRRYRPCTLCLVLL